MVGVLDGLRLAALGEVGGEAEAALGVLDDAAELAPPPQRLVRRVLGLDVPEVLQVALHPLSPAPPPPPLLHCSGGWTDGFVGRVNKSRQVRIDGRVGEVEEEEEAAAG